MLEGARQLSFLRKETFAQLYHLLKRGVVNVIPNDAERSEESKISIHKTAVSCNEHFGFLATLGMT